MVFQVRFEKFDTRDELLYLAGLVDGRMSIRYPRIGLRLEKRKMLLLLKREFGGSVFQHENMPHFEAHGSKAVNLLKRVLVHLNIRAQKARKFIAMWNEHKQRVK